MTRGAGPAVRAIAGGLIALGIVAGGLQLKSGSNSAALLGERSGSFQAVRGKPGLVLAPVPRAPAVLPQPNPVDLGPAKAPAPLSPIEGLRAAVLQSLQASGGSVKAAVSIEGVGDLLQHEASVPFPPASTQKIYTAYAALSVLGPEYVYETRLLRHGPIQPDGVLQGHLALVGGGDPSLSKADVERLAAAAAAGGIRNVSGDLVGIEDRYDSNRSAAGWRDDYLTHESGTLSALAVDGNDHREDPAFIANPVEGNLQIFRTALTMAGVAVAGREVHAGTGLPGGELVAVHHSRPLGELVRHMLQESDNFWAELMIKELGKTAGRPTTAGGLDVVANFARRHGLPLGPSADGSGLSALSAQTAQGQVAWLRAIRDSGLGQMFKHSLPVSCVPPGTLKRRMCASAASGKVFAKSGGLPRVATLAGYTTTASRRPVLFSVSLVGAPTGRQARDAIDTALAHVASFTH